MGFQGIETSYSLIKSAWKSIWMYISHMLFQCTEYVCLKFNTIYLIISDNIMPEHFGTIYTKYNWPNSL